MRVRGNGRLFLIHMTMMKYASLALLLVLGAALSGSSASAQILDTTGSLDVNGTTSSEQAATDTTVDVSADAAATSTDAMEADSASSIELTVNRDTLDADTDYAISDADFVRSSGSLESYASATVRADERLESIVVADGRMEMEYRKSAKFLWLIPASMTVHVAVDEDGEVSVRYPWYSFLMKTEMSRAEIEASLAAEISDINASVDAAATAGTSGIQANADVRRWARIIESAYAAVSGSAWVDASAEAGT